MIQKPLRRAEDHAQWYWQFAEQKDRETKAALAQVAEMEVQVGTRETG